jgi:hypothetical protein
MQRAFVSRRAVSLAARIVAHSATRPPWYPARQEVRLVCRVLGELLAANHVRQRKAAGLREGVVQHDEPLLRKDCWHDDLEDVFVALPASRVERTRPPVDVRLGAGLRFAGGCGDSHGRNLVRVKEHERNLRPTGRSVFIAVDEG